MAQGSVNPRQIARYTKQLVTILTHFSNGEKIKPYLGDFQGHMDRKLQILVATVEEMNDPSRLDALRQAIVDVLRLPSYDVMLGRALVRFLHRHRISFPGLTDALELLRSRADIALIRAKNNFKDVDAAVALYLAVTNSEKAVVV